VFMNSKTAIVLVCCILFSSCAMLYRKTSIVATYELENGGKVELKPIPIGEFYMIGLLMPFFPFYKKETINNLQLTVTGYSSGCPDISLDDGFIVPTEMQPYQYRELCTYSFRMIKSIPTGLNFRINGQPKQYSLIIEKRSEWHYRPFFIPLTD